MIFYRDISYISGARKQLDLILQGAQKYSFELIQYYFSIDGSERLREEDGRIGPKTVPPQLRREI